MTPQPQQQYIVYENELCLLEFAYVSNVFDAHTTVRQRADFVNKIRSRPVSSPQISNIEFAKGLAECLGNEPEEHEECNICPLRGKCIDLHLGTQHDAAIAARVWEDERKKRIKDYEHLKTHIIETCNYHGGNWTVDQIINRINRRLQSLRRNGVIGDDNNVD